MLKKTILRAINSLLPQLQNDIRLLLINDGSSDDSKVILKDALKKSSYIEYIEQENQGLSRALGAGIQYLQNKNIKEECFVARLDSDDEYTPNGARQLLDLIKKTDGKYMCYIAGLVDSEDKPLTIFNEPNQFFSYKDALTKKPVDYLDSVCPILNLKCFNNPKYSYDKVPARAGDGIPATRIGKDYGYYLSDIYFYKVHMLPNSLSRRKITPEYAQVALETNLIILNEFLLPTLSRQKKEAGNKSLICSRYYAVLNNYKKAIEYFFLGIKYNPKNFLYIGVALICFLPQGYKIVNFFVEKFLFKNNK